MPGVTATSQAQAEVLPGCSGNPHDRDSGTNGNPHDQGEAGNPHDVGGHHDQHEFDACPGSKWDNLLLFLIY